MIITAKKFTRIYIKLMNGERNNYEFVVLSSFHCILSLNYCKCMKVDVFAHKKAYMAVYRKITTFK